MAHMLPNLGIRSSAAKVSKLLAGDVRACACRSEILLGKYRV